MRKRKQGQLHDVPDWSIVSVSARTKKKRVLVLVLKKKQKNYVVMHSCLIYVCRYLLHCCPAYPWQTSTNKHENNLQHCAKLPKKTKSTSRLLPSRLAKISQMTEAGPGATIVNSIISECLLPNTTGFCFFFCVFFMGLGQTRVSHFFNSSLITA